MNFGISELLGIGALAVGCAAVVLWPLVRIELAPAARLTGGGRWLLAAALGMGVLAFAFKLTVIVLISALPGTAISALLAGTPAPRPAAMATAADPFRASAAPPNYIWQALPERAPEPPDNPATAAKIALGERLFNEKALSRDRSLSCASCHDLDGHAGADGRPTALGVDSKPGARNVPTVWNAAFQTVLFWDGRAASLEEQAKGPLLNPIEMAMPSAAAVAERLAGRPDYRRDFDAAFGAGSPITLDAVAAAIAAYERTLVAGNSPYDRFVRGDAVALSPTQLRGMALFQSLGCVGCHGGPNFSNASVFGDVAPLRLFPANPTAYTARYRLAQDGSGVWRVPSLRNVAVTAPYFHNGAVDDLAEAVRIMASAQLGRAGPGERRPERQVVWSPAEHTLSAVDRAAVTPGQVADIVAFLQALTDDRFARVVK